MPAITWKGGEAIQMLQNELSLLERKPDNNPVATGLSTSRFLGLFN